MTTLRHRLIAEHLACLPEEVAAREASCGSMIGAIEALRGQGKTLVPLAVAEPGAVEKVIATNEVLDPESPEHMFEPIGKHRLSDSWAKGKALLARRMGRT
jgi:hypothetical protein